MPPRPGIEPDDIVTPAKAAALLGDEVAESTVRTWIHRYKVEPLGVIGRWNVYDFRDIAAIDARLARQRAQRPAA